MAEEGNSYTGFLYAGLMVDAEQNVKVLEYNCRFGDPETQPIMMRLKTSLVELCQSALNGQLDSADVAWDSRVAVGVVMAAGGYPDSYPKGDVITFPEQLPGNVKIFHAGTAMSDDTVVTSGGRVLCVTALADTVTEAQKQAYAAVEQVNWPGAYYRTDIAYRAIAREQNRV
jgi:phosphoribosylamine--glycine ligase